MNRSSSRSHRVKRGLDLPITGAPEQRVEDGRRVGAVAVLALDHVGLKQKLHVAVGDRVVRGQLLFEDRRNPGVRFTSPGAGTVAAINRGEKRALESVVIDLDEQDSAAGADAPEVEYETYTGAEPSSLSAEQIRALLIETGMWTALRARPFSRTPAPGSEPRAIFVTATDTNPLTADVDAALAGREQLFEAGLAALVKLAGGRPVYLCARDGSAIADRGVAGVETHRFSGPHPAGTAGLHMHLIDPAGAGRVMWHVGYQDVAAIGGLLRTGRLRLERVIALAGPSVTRPRLLGTRVGARIADLLEGEIAEGDVRVISGSVLAGRVAADGALGFLGRFHNQLTVLPEAGKMRLFGWLWPGSDRFSVSRMFLSRLLPGKRFAMDTDLHGGPRTLVPSGVYDKVLPFDLLPVFLFRALLSGDVDRAEELGCLELDEEDLALCSYACPSKIDYGSALRAVLEQIESEG